MKQSLPRIYSRMRRQFRLWGKMKIGEGRRPMLLSANKRGDPVYWHKAYAHTR